MTDHTLNDHSFDHTLRRIGGGMADLPPRGHTFDFEDIIKTYLESPDGRDVLRRALEDIDNERRSA